MMNILSKLISVDTANKTSDLNISTAISAHVTWKVKLQKYVDHGVVDGFDPQHILRDDQCVLGQWIHSQSNKHLNSHESFKTLREVHSYFHVVASNVVSNIQDGNVEAAQELLKGEYARASRDVVAGLLLLDKHMKERKELFA